MTRRAALILGSVGSVLLASALRLAADLKPVQSQVPAKVGVYGATFQYPARIPVCPGETSSVQVTLTNTGTLTWPTWPYAALSAGWYTAEGTQQSISNVAQIGTPVQPGGRITLSVPLLHYKPGWGIQFSLALWPTKTGPALYIPDGSQLFKVKIDPLSSIPPAHIYCAKMRLAPVHPVPTPQR